MWIRMLIQDFVKLHLCHCPTDIVKLEAQGVIDKISDWAAPIVPAINQDGAIRIVEMVTVNKIAKTDL